MVNSHWGEMNKSLPQEFSFGGVKRKRLCKSLTSPLSGQCVVKLLLFFLYLWFTFLWESLLFFCNFFKNSLTLVSFDPSLDFIFRWGRWVVRKWRRQKVTCHRRNAKIDDVKMNPNESNRLCWHAELCGFIVSVWCVPHCRVWPATAATCVPSSQGRRFHGRPRWELWGRVDPVGPVTTRPQGVPGLSAWTISDRGHEQTHTGECQCSPFTWTLDFSRRFSAVIHRFQQSRQKKLPLRGFKGLRIHKHDLFGSWTCLLLCRITHTSYKCNKNDYWCIFRLD